MKPQDPDARAAAVAAAVRTLEKIGATFTVADVADRAGVSRATIYRSTALRALVGAKGDGPRTVDATLHEKLTARHDAAKARARDLRRQLAELERSWDEMRTRALTAERTLAEMQRRVDFLQSQSGTRGGQTMLASLASQMSAEERRQARRQLARALHPDLFAHDSAVQTVATELLKLVNSLAE